MCISFYGVFRLNLNYCVLYLLSNIIGSSLNLMSKETNQYIKEVSQKTPGMVYIRGMSDGPKRELSPLQKGINLGLSGIILGGSVGCVAENVVNTVTPESTMAPTPESSPLPSGVEFSRTFTRDSVFDLATDDQETKEGKAIIRENLNIIAQNCETVFPGIFVVGSERYTQSQNINKESTIWSFCEVKDDVDAPVRTMVASYKWSANGVAEENQDIYKEMVKFDDGTLGYVDDDGASHVIFGVVNNFVEVYNLDEKVIAKYEVTPETIKLINSSRSYKEVAKAADKYSAEAVAFVPHSIEQIGQSVEVRSPIDDPVGYKEDVEKVLKVIHEQILPNYSGGIINYEATIGISEERGSVMFQKDSTLNPIASVFFEWNGYKVPILYFPAEDNQSKFVIGMAISPTMGESNYNTENPAPDWRLSEIIKKFPMTVDKGFLETRETNAAKYSKVLTSKDPFFSAYFSGHENSDYMKVLWDYFINNGNFDKSYESFLLIILGGQ